MATSRVKYQILKNSGFISGALSNQSRIAQKKSRLKKSIIASLTLTSLIDAFSILVIYLLTNASNTQIPFDMRGGMQIPQAKLAESLSYGSVVRVQNGEYFIDLIKVSINDLPVKLRELKEKNPKEIIIIQADRKLPFAEMNPIILAMAQAGVEKFQFAVLAASVSAR